MTTRRRVDPDDTYDEGTNPSNGWRVPDPDTLTAAARVLGRKGGASKSPAKVAAVRANGRLGGRPRKEQS